MTSNQIAYWNWDETRRHNLVTEQQNNKGLAENKRHNIVSESISYKQTLEQARHNQVTEQIGFGELMEATRHNKVNEALGYGQLVESQRHNVATEKETNRHNLVVEKQSQDQINLGYANLELGYANLRETARHNVASENIGYSNIKLGYSKLANEAMIARNNLLEAKRHNVAVENATIASNAERVRSNTANEQIQKRRNDISSSQLVEDVRHNTQTEKTASYRAKNEVYQGYLNTAITGIDSYYEKASGTLKTFLKMLN